MKHTTIIIREDDSIEIERERTDQGAWIKRYARDFKDISPASQRRLARVLASVEWSRSESDSWFESGLGYDYRTTTYCSYPPLKSEPLIDLGNWVAYIVGIERLPGQGR